MMTNKSKEQIIDLEQNYVVQSYIRPPFVVTHGEGVTVYDSEGNAYLDFVSGIAVNALGYGDPELSAAIKAAVDTGMIHISNLYHTAPHAETGGDAVRKVIRRPGVLLQ